MSEATGLEAMLDRLDHIAGDLERGDKPLEDALKLFEEGIKLAREGQRRIDEAEHRIEILLAGDTSKERLEPFSQG
jgi:exodeoxyribonuclease VII small subunit